MDAGASLKKQDQRICSQTGLALVPSNSQSMHRIAKSSYGPMNPLLRDPSEHPSSWGRYDVAGHRTVYGASPAAGAYAESLAVYRPAGHRAPSVMNTALATVFPESDPYSTLTLAEAAQEEWDEQFRTGDAFLAASWRHDRLEYILTLPPTGWFVDIEHSQSVATLSQAIGTVLAEHDLGSLTVGHLRGGNRAVTTAAAGWIRDQVLDDGALPHGVRYGSKWGSEFTCWAVWLRGVDDGDDPAQDVLKEPTRADAGRPILDSDQNPPFRQVTDLFQLQCH